MNRVTTAQANSLAFRSHLFSSRFSVVVAAAAAAVRSIISIAFSTNSLFYPIYSDDLPFHFLLPSFIIVYKIVKCSIDDCAVYKYCIVQIKQVACIPHIYIQFCSRSSSINSTSSSSSKKVLATTEKWQISMTKKWEKTKAKYKMNKIKSFVMRYISFVFRAK